ncbi:MAG: hypothetical protein [Microviridae sp.]|nr:MAG: hypothetical protein [Microviridae sp.]
MAKEKSIRMIKNTKDRNEILNDIHDWLKKTKKLLRAKAEIKNLCKNRNGASRYLRCEIIILILIMTSIIACRASRTFTIDKHTTIEYKKVNK